MKKQLELYIHIPFCVKKCAYCDFLSGPADDQAKKEYVHALIEEVKHCGDYSAYDVVSIFFGGGTPSVLPGTDIEQIMTAIRSHFHIKEDAEITIEANPGTIDAEKLRGYKRAGINRISFGCQSSDNQELKMLGRIHTWEEFLESYQLARANGFHNINVDLMSGLPNQTTVSWEQTLRRVADLEPEHISAYSLIVEEGTPFYDMADNLNLPEEEEERAMYENTSEVLAEYGYEQYEISNYAKNGKACQHNIGYWIGREYLGLGLGSSSLVSHCRFHNTEDMKEYLVNSTDPEYIRKDMHELTKEEQIEEFMMLGLRMNYGVSEEEFQYRFGLDIDEVYGEILHRYEKEGYLSRQGGRIFFTRKGISVSNVILSEMIFD